MVIMKNYLANILSIFIILAGGIYLIQPTDAYACPECPTCTIEPGEEPCSECFASTCQEIVYDYYCGALEDHDGSYIYCYSETPPGDDDDDDN